MNNTTEPIAPNALSDAELFEATGIRPDSRQSSARLIGALGQVLQPRQTLRDRAQSAVERRNKLSRKNMSPAEQAAAKTAAIDSELVDLLERTQKLSADSPLARATVAHIFEPLAALPPAGIIALAIAIHPSFAKSISSPTVDAGATGLQRAVQAAKVEKFNVPVPASSVAIHNTVRSVMQSDQCRHLTGLDRALAAHLAESHATKMFTADTRSIPAPDATARALDALFLGEADPWPDATVIPSSLAEWAQAVGESVGASKEAILKRISEIHTLLNPPTGAPVIENYGTTKATSVLPKVFTYSALSLLRVSNGALNDAALPGRLKILEWGRNPSSKGDVVLDDYSASQLPLNQGAGFAEVALDFEHNTVPDSEEFKRTTEPRAVAGYGTPIVVRGDGLYLDRMRWTPQGQANARNYIDLSPAVATDAQGRVTFVHSCALTRNGAVHGLHFYGVH
jgi:Mu-like prophage I protein